MLQAALCSLDDEGAALELSKNKHILEFVRGAFDILFSQGSISSRFNGGAHRNSSVDRTIEQVLSREIHYSDFKFQISNFKI